MLRLIVAVYTVCCITLMSSHSAWTFCTDKRACGQKTSRCRLVPGIDAGAGAIDTLPNGLAFISSGVDPKARGNIFLFDFNKPRCGAQALDIVGDLDRVTFSPHGVSIWTDSNRNITYIFVTNDFGDTYTVEKFCFDEKRRKLYHVRTYHDKTFTRIFNVLATGEDRFYFVNAYQYNLALEICLRLRHGNVGFYDGTKGRIVITGLSVPVGINKSPDGKYLYLAEVGEERFTVYARKSNKRLRLEQVVPMRSHLTKITVDETTGDLLVAGHPDTESLVKYLTPPHTTRSPSQVFRLTMCDGGSRVSFVEEVYNNDGRQLSASSVALQYGRHLLIGSIHKTMLICNLSRG